MRAETRTFLITFVVGLGIAAIVAAKLISVRAQEDGPASVEPASQPVAEQADPQPVPEQPPAPAPAAPVTWAEVNGQRVAIDKSYWDADRARRESQIAADLAAKQAAAAVIYSNQAALKAQQDWEAQEVWRHQRRQIQNASPAVQSVGPVRNAVSH